MFNRLPPLKSLRAFESAARHGSFTLAAVELSVTQGAISYQIRNLEQKMGITLFQRKVRQVYLTEAGEHLYQVAHRLFRELEDSIASIVPENIPNILTISVSTFFVTRWLSSRVGSFIIRHPDITIRLQHSVSDPDFSVDDVDMAIRWGNGEWPDCQSERLISSPMIMLCAPKFLKGKNALKSPKDLSNYVLLHDQPGIDRWDDWLELAGAPDLKGDNGPMILDSNVRVQSAIDGHGLVLANRLLTPEIERGLLVEPFPFRLTGLGFYLAYKEGALASQSNVKFRQWLLSEVDKDQLPAV